MGMARSPVFSARTTEEGLRLLNSLRQERGIGWDDLYGKFAAPDADLTVQPDRAARSVYDDLGAEFERRIAEVLKNQASS